MLDAARQRQRLIGAETPDLAVDVQLAVSGGAQHDFIAVVAVCGGVPASFFPNAL